MRAERGTTLFELVTTIAIIGIVVAVTVPDAVGMRRVQGAGRGARELALVLRAAQARAQAGESDVVCVVDDDGGYVVRRRQPGRAPDVVIARGVLAAGPQSTYPDGAISFSAEGWPTLPGSSTPRAGSFHFRGDHAVIVQLAGCIRYR